MRILVTGAAGFIGHHVAAYLDRTDHAVTAMVRGGAVGSERRLQEVCFLGDLVWHDLRSPVNEMTAKQLGDFDVVLHMAAETHVDRSILSPEDFVMSNVLGTTHLLQWARAHAKRFVLFSTDEVFGPALYGEAYDEHASHSPRNPYAASKSAAEQMVTAFANTYGLEVTIVRGMNVFGERQHREKWVPTVIRKLFNHEVISVHADKSRTKAGSRFYIHAGNVAKAIELILEKGGYGPYHIVGEREVDNEEMVLTIAGMMGVEPRYELVDFHSSRPGHDLRYAMADNNLRELGWVIPQSFEQSLDRTVVWYLEHKEWL